MIRRCALYIIINIYRTQNAFYIPWQHLGHWKTMVWFIYFNKANCFVVDFGLCMCMYVLFCVFVYMHVCVFNCACVFMYACKIVKREICMCLYVHLGKQYESKSTALQYFFKNTFVIRSYKKSSNIAYQLFVIFYPSPTPLSDFITHLYILPYKII